MVRGLNGISLLPALNPRTLVYKDFPCFFEKGRGIAGGAGGCLDWSFSAFDFSGDY